MQTRWLHLRKHLWALPCTLSFVALLGAGTARAQTNPPRLQIAPLPDHRVQLIITGAPQRFLRVDASTNFTSWRPLALLTNTTGTVTHEDTNAPALPMRFYRAADVPAMAGVTSLSQPNGSVGAQIEIFGQFFDGRPGDNVVRIGDVFARVIESGPTRLLIEVPTNATTGPLTVATPSGETSVRQFFVVTGPALGTFEPPPGVDAAQFALVNPYGGATPLAPGNPTNEFLVRRGRPIVNMAVPTNLTDRTVFIAVTLSDGVPFVINAASTAQGLVFLHPFLQTPDPAVAAPLLDLIAADSKVQLLASNIAALYPLGGDPFTNATFFAAYSNAVLSVAGGPGAADLKARPAKFATELGIGAADEESFIQVVNDYGDVYVKGADGNPVDWSVTLSRVNISEAFPHGERDYSRAVQSDKGLRVYPLVPGEEVLQRFVVRATLIADKFDIVGSVAEELEEYIAPSKGEKLRLLDDNSIYVLRAIGPSWLPHEEWQFVHTNYGGQYTRIVAINLVSAFLDAVGPFVPDSVGNDFEKELADAVLREATYVDSGATYFAAVVNVVKTAVPKLVAGGAKAGVIKHGTEALAESILKGTLALAFKVVEIVGAVGAVAERAIHGIASTTTMDTIFIQTGNPFKLSIVSVSPPGAAVGEPLDIVIRGPQFDTNNHVYFVNERTPGQVLSTMTLPDGNQKITVQVPEALATNREGVIFLAVFINSQFAVSNFTLVHAPKVTSMDPLDGFAPTPDYLGVPLSGTQVHLRGTGFEAADTFLFGSSAAVYFSTTDRDVIVYVPTGAVSGPITIRHTDPFGVTREGHSPPFTVLGPPVILTNYPGSGYAGGGLRVGAAGLGPGPATLLLNDVPMDAVSRAGPQLAGVIPAGAAPGLSQLRVVTPAGQSAPVDFYVLPGPAPGSLVKVGGPFTEYSPTTMSVITLARAALFTGTTNTLSGAPDCTGEFCVDDLDVVESGGEITYLDPPLEEGDFMTDHNGPGDLPPRFPVGATYLDSVVIIGTVAGDATFTGDHDSIYGSDASATIEGALTIAGNYNHLSGLFIKGTLTISGNNNEVNVIVGGAPGAGVIIRGDHNYVIVTSTNNGGDGLVIDGGNFNQVGAFSLAFGNAGNGFTVIGGATGNILSVGTAFPGIPPEPGSGNSGHGIALLDASHTAIFGTGYPIGGNGGNGIHLSGTNVSDTEMHTAIADGNVGHGFYIGPGVSRTLIQPGIASRNRGNGVFLDGCRATTLLGMQARFNTNFGILVSGVADGETALDFFTQGNGRSGLCLSNGTSLVGGTGVNVSGSVGLELSGADVTHNSINMLIDGCSADGARLFSAQSNNLILAIGNCAGHGLFVSGGGGNLVTLTASNNMLDGARFTDGAQANTIGATVMSNRTGLVLAGGANNNLVQDLRANANTQHGLWLTGAGTRNNRVLDARVGLSILTDPTNEPPGNALDGIRIDAGANDNSLGSDDGHGPEVRNNGASGIRIAGATNNVILGALITHGASAIIQPAGIIVENSAADTIIGGSTAASRCTISFNLDGIRIQSGATRTDVQNCLVEANGGTGLLIDNAPQNFIGGGLRATNDFINNFASGVALSGAGTTNCRVSGNNISGHNDGVFVRNGADANTIFPDNDIHHNATGVRVDGATRTDILRNFIHDNSGNGIVCTGGAADNDIIANFISRNAMGVVVDGFATVRNGIVGNVITANAGKGIALLGLANYGIEAPLITSLTSQSVMGTNSAPDGSMIDVFSDPDDEGETFFGRGYVHHGRFSATLNKPLKITDVGVHFNLHATVTDTNGNTSEFGDYIGGGNANGGAQIAFTSTRDGNAEIYLTDGSSLPPTRLTSDPADDNSPALSPDGTMLAFVSMRSGNQEIFTLALSNATSVAQRTTNAAADYDPAWSPNGSNIIFVSERDGNAEIYRMNADGTGLQRLTFDGGMDRWPGYSPDGAKIVFASTRNGSFDLFIMDANGSNVMALVTHAAADTRPVWSPDGELIAFVSDRDGDLEIYTVKPDGTSLTRLTFDAATDTEPSWLPNGQTLVFSSDRDEGSELYIVPRAGGPAVRLTVSAGDNFHPSAARR